MSKPFVLEVFETDRGFYPTNNQAQVSGYSEEARLEAFEQGYKAGWDDSHTSHETDQDKISSDFARNLNELSFTYHEVRSTLLRSLEPLLREMVSKVLPRIAQASLGELISDQILQMVDHQSSTPVELLVSTQNKAALEKLTENKSGLPITVSEESSLGEGQVFIRLGESETQIDIKGVLEGFENALDGFYDSEEKEMTHG